MTMKDKQFTACIGLACADDKHDYCLRDATSQEIQYGVFQHTPALIDKSAVSLKDSFNHQPVAIFLELKSGLIVPCLLKYDFITLFLLFQGH
jgi:hypothetical protein